MKFGIWLAALLLTASVDVAWAQDENDSLDTLPPLEMPEAEPRTTDRSGGFALRIGPYEPADIFGGEASSITFQDVYGSGFTPMYGIEWEYQPLHHQYIGVLGIGAGAAFYQNKGTALKEDGTVSSQELSLMIIPATVNVVYRMALFEDQPIVPYGGAGLDYWYFQEGKSGTAGSTVSGAKSGWHWRAGGELLLDVFDPKAAGALDSGWGINNTHIFGEYRQSNLGVFGESQGFDFSNETWFAGLYFEY